MLTAPVNVTNGGVPKSASGTWSNVSGGAGLDFCIVLLQQATIAAQSDSNITQDVYLNNIDAERTLLWLWFDLTELQFFTVAFHGADGPTPRYCTCAGKSNSLTAAQASALWMSAISQFAILNGTTTNTIYLCSERDQEPTTADALFTTFELIAEQADAPANEDYYTVPPQERWPSQQTTRRFKLL